MPQKAHNMFNNTQHYAVFTRILHVRWDSVDIVDPKYTRFTKRNFRLKIISVHSVSKYLLKIGTLSVHVSA